ncbi:unnamed protein product [Ectocarpus sp. 13 AM-2016]
MKAAAAKFLEEEARVKADKEEKMTKFRDSACDAAARTIQQMYYVFSATRITQKRAKEVYTKHFDSENLAFYWHNTLIDTYLWEKPTGLGGWDADPEDRWEVIAGSYKLHYYFNPKSYTMQWSQPAGTVICKECGLQFSMRWCNRDSKPFCDACYEARHFSQENPSTGPLSYKTLDGAVPGSKDLVDFDYISEQSDIAVETWEQQPSSLAVEGQQVVPIPEVLEAAALDDAGAAGSDGGSQYAVQQYVAGTSDIVRYGRSDGEPPGVLQPAGVRDEADGGTGESEMEEYLNSQQTFTYDNPSEGISNAEQIEHIGGNDNSFNTPNGALREGGGNNTRAVPGGSNDVAWEEKKEGVEASASGIGTASFAPESWGWATPGSASSGDDGRVESANSGKFFDGVMDCPATGPLPAGLGKKTTTNNGSVRLGGGEAASIAGMEGVVKAEASEYNPSTPSYGFDE